MKPSGAGQTYRLLVRGVGLALVALGAVFQRRGLMELHEVVYILACVAFQESFLRLRVLRRFRGPMFAVYSMLPMALVLLSLHQIQPHARNGVSLVLLTPLPLALVSVQVMVLYLKESSRLASVVLVLTLFATVIGLRRPSDDIVWPWLAAIGALAALWLALLAPQKLYEEAVPIERRPGARPVYSLPAGILGGPFFGVVGCLAVAVLSVAALLFFTLPRIHFDEDALVPTVAETPDRPGGGGAAGGGAAGGQDGPPGIPEGGRGLSSSTGLSDHVGLGDFGAIKLQPGAVLEVAFVEGSGPPPDFSAPLYLRAYTFGAFDGEQWRPVETAGGTEIPEGQRRTLVGAPDYRDAVPARQRDFAFPEREYEIVLVGPGLGDQGEVPAPAEAIATGGYDGRLTYDSETNVLRATSLEKGQSLVVRCRELALDGLRLERLLRDSQPPEASASLLDPAYFELPADLAETVRDMKYFQEFLGPDSPRRSQWDRAADIVQYFREATVNQGSEPAYRYSLSERPEPGPNPVGRFLRSERFGHCEYFASGMCALLRAGGIPCRLAAGFAATRHSAEKNAWVVQASEAHAWVEVWFEQLGWLAFDPTPPQGVVSPPDIDAASMEAPVDEPPDTPPDDPTVEDSSEPEPVAEDEPYRDPFAGFDRAAQERLLAGIESAFDDAIASIDDGLAGATSWLPGSWLPSSGILRVLILLAPVSTALVLWLVFRRRRRRMLRKVLAGMDKNEAKRLRESLFVQLLLLLARFGFRKRPGETPREFAGRVLRRGGERFGPLPELMEHYYIYRFGGENAAVEARREFKRRLGALARRLREKPSHGQNAS